MIKIERDTILNGDVFYDEEQDMSVRVLDCDRENDIYTCLTGKDRYTESYDDVTEYGVAVYNKAQLEKLTFRCTKSSNPFYN